MRAIIPAYTDVFVAQCVRAAKAGLGPKMSVILNPQSGPGLDAMPSLVKAQQELTAAGAEVWLYLDAVAGPGYSPMFNANWQLITPGTVRNKLGLDLQYEVKRYERGYQKPTGYFLDDTTTGEHFVACEGVMVGRRRFWNPGNARDAVKFDKIGDVVCVFEDKNFLSKFQRSTVRAKAAALALEQRDWRPALFKARQFKLDYFFCTDTSGNPWRAAPSYFTEFLKAL